MPKQQKTRRNTLPRKSSPDGIQERFERREKTYPSKGVPKGGTWLVTEAHKPGSRNPRKVGR
jgi:hypothetical protein